MSRSPKQCFYAALASVAAVLLGPRFSEYMADNSLSNGADQLPQSRMTHFPSAFRRHSVATWVVVSLVIIFSVVTLALFFEAVAPVSDFWFQPGVTADSNTYWMMSGVRGSNDLTNASSGSDEPQYGGGSWGPVLQAKLFRNDVGIILSNCALLIVMFWLIGTMREFDITTFALLLVVNPMLFSVVATLNKEIYSALGLVIFLRYMTAKRFRLILLILAVAISVGGHWQQALVLLLLAALESRISPVRRKHMAGLMVVLALFTIGYTVVYHLAPVVIAGLLAQAQAGRLIMMFDNIQGNLGLPLVVIPKILMNVMGRFSTPWYFFSDYWDADFANWYDQIFTQAQELFTTILLFALLFRRQLPLRHPLVYLLAVYLVLTAVNPMVQPRYEYAAYVLLCLQASRYYPLGKGSRHGGNRLTQGSPDIVPSVS